MVNFVPAALYRFGYVIVVLTGHLFPETAVHLTPGVWPTFQYHAQVSGKGWTAGWPLALESHWRASVSLLRPAACHVPLCL